MPVNCISAPLTFQTASGRHCLCPTSEADSLHAGAEVCTPPHHIQGGTQNALCQQKSARGGGGGGGLKLRCKTCQRKPPESAATCTSSPKSGAEHTAGAFAEQESKLACEFVAREVPAGIRSQMPSRPSQTVVLPSGHASCAGPGLAAGNAATAAWLLVQARTHGICRDQPCPI